MRHFSWQIVVRLAIVCALASGLALIAVTIESSGYPAILPERLPVLLLVGVLVLILQYTHSQVLRNKLLFLIGLTLAFGGGLWVMAGCGFNPSCTLWGESFRIQHTSISLVMVSAMIWLTIKTYQWSKDELIHFFQRVVIGVIVFLPLSVGMFEISLDHPQISSRLLFYSALLLLSLTSALVTLNLTSHSVDPHPAQTVIHSFIPVGGLLIIGSLVAVVLSSEARQFIVSSAQFIFSSIMALFALVIGLLAIPMQWLIGDMSQMSPGLPTPTPPPLGPSPLDGLSEKMVELNQEPASTPLMMYVIQAMVVGFVLLIGFLILKRLSHMLLTSLEVAPNTQKRESIWSWNSFREELAELLPRFKRSTAQEPTTFNRQQIRELYRRMLDRAQGRKLERKPSATPRTFGQTLKTQLNPQAVEQLTTLYEQARYGPEPRSSDVDAAKSAFDSLDDS